ncbi:MAG: response regulator [Bacteroidota bacterium]
MMPSFCKILVVDDDPLNIKVLNELLLENPASEFEILNAHNGNLAVEVARREMPDVMITDWEMPGMNGIELIRALKADERTAQIPVIMASGIMLTSDDLDIALAAGAVDYIRKPIDPVELRARVRSALEMAWQLSELRKKHAIIVEQERELMRNNISRLERELDFKQRELTSNISFLIQQENDKVVYVDEINKLRPYLNAEGKVKLTRLAEGLVSADNSKSRLELENRFSEVNFRFFEAMEKSCPGITKSEKVLAAYMLLNLSPSEIASATNKNLNSVNVAFSRLRIKFNVASNIELKDVLMQLQAGAI